jgi:hypothetical protein
VHPGQDGDLGVEVVVHFDAGLAGVGALDAADLLHDASLERGGAGQDQSVEAGQVEPFACDLVDGQQDVRGVGLLGELLSCGGPHGRGQSTVQDQRIKAFGAQIRGQGIEVADSVGEHEDAPSPFRGVEDVGDDLLITAGVGG